MKLTTIVIALFSFLFAGAQSYNIQWGEMAKGTGRMISVLPKSGKDFYALRWSGGALLGSYRLSNHENFKITASGKMEMNADGGMANFEGAQVIGEKLVVFLSDKKEGKNHFFMQEYGADMLPKGAAIELANYDLEKGKSKGAFDIIISRDKTFFGVVWVIPGKKEEKDRYGFKIFDNDMNEVSDGDYKLPFEGNLSMINQHYLSNTGDYFINVIEYNEPAEKKLFKSYMNYKAMHIFHITPDDLVDFTINLEGKHVEAVTMNSNNDKIFTLTGIYGEQGKFGVSGLFFLRANFDKQEIIDEGFEKFGNDFITQDWSEIKKRRAEKREQNGKGEPKLYNYNIRQMEVLKDGSIVGSLEQYYVIVTEHRSGGITGGVGGYAPSVITYTYTYYYNDIIAFKVGVDGGFEWLKKIRKTQVSTDDGGPYSSYARFVNEGKLCFIFNDNVKNYDESGKFNGGDKIYPANFGKKKNVVAIVELDLEDGTISRKTFFDRKEITAIAVPKLFKIDYNTREMLLYAVYGKKERFSILQFNE